MYLLRLYLFHRYKTEFVRIQVYHSAGARWVDSGQGHCCHEQDREDVSMGILLMALERDYYLLTIGLTTFHSQ